MNRKTIAAVLFIAVVALASTVSGDSSSPITFREWNGQMEMRNQEISVFWAKSVQPNMEIQRGILGFSVGGLDCLEVKDINRDYNFTEDQIVAKTEAKNQNTWGYSSSRILSGNGFQVDHTSPLAVTPSGSKSVSISISTVVSDRDISLNKQMIRTDEVLVTLTISNWPWVRYDDVLAGRISIGSDLMPEGETNLISGAGTGTQALSPYSMHGTLISNDREVGSIHWNHEAETVSSGTAMTTLVQVYASHAGSDTDMTFVFSGAYGADKITYSFILEAFKAPNDPGGYPDYTVPIVSGVVVVLVLAAVMFRRRNP